MIYRTAVLLFPRYQVEEALFSLSVDRLADHFTYDKFSSTGWKLLSGTVTTTGR